MPKFIDLSGQKFGKLTVISRAENKNKKIQLNCVCDCGKKTIVFSLNLKRGNTQSCGCLNTHNRFLGDDSMSSKMALYRHYRDGCAKKRSLSFSLTPEEFLNLTQQNCFYCGIHPKQVSKIEYSRKYFIYNGLDRLDNNKGYDLNNVVPCCKNCNRAKWDMNKDEFIGWIKRCYNNLKLKGIL